MRNSSFAIIGWLLIATILFGGKKVAAQNCFFSPCFDNDCGDLNVGFTPLGGPQFCEGQTITLTNTSAAGFDFFVVDWRDGNVDTLFGYGVFEHVYTIPDTLVCDGPPIRPFSLCFKGQSDCPDGISCQSGTYDFGIIVRPEASFTSPFQLCVNTAVTLTNNSCNASDYHWDFGNGITSTETNPQINFDEPGTYNILLTASNQCGIDMYSANIEVVNPPEAEFSFETDPLSGCSPLLVTLDNESVNSYSQSWSVIPANPQFWELADTNLTLNSPNIELIFYEAGEYEITLEAENACGVDEFTQTIEVYEEISVQLNPPEPFCEETTLTTSDLNFSVSGSVEDIDWTFVNGSIPSATGENFPPVTFSESGEITVIVNGNCSDTVIEFPIVIIEEEIEFGNNPGEICQSAPAIQLEAKPDGGVWSGPGISDGEEGVFDPSILQGNQSYTLTYSFEISPCEISGEIEIFVIESEAGSFDPPMLCEDSDITTLNAEPVGGIWSGQGITDTVNGVFDPSASGVGSFQITYQFLDSNNCLVEILDQLEVESIPVLNLNDSILLCLDDFDENLNDISQVNANPSGGTFNWSGPGVTDSGGTFNPQSAGLNTGFYTLYVTYERNACTVQDSTVIELVEKEEPEVSFTDTLICAASTSLQIDASPEGGTWSGPGVNAQSGEIDIDVAGVGTHLYQYAFQEGTSCEINLSVEVEIVDPGVDLNVGEEESSCERAGFYSLAAAHPPGGSWSGEGVVDPAEGMIVLDSLEPGNTYEYQYCVESNVLDNCVACGMREFHYYVIPVAAFDAEEFICRGNPFTPENNSQNGHSYLWDFGDGNTSSEPNPSHIFTQIGTYIITLETTSPEGCTATESQVVTAIEEPESDFHIPVTEGCSPFELEVENLGGGQLVDFIWVIGGDSINGENPGAMELESVGKDSIFKVKLIASNFCGMDVTEKEVFVHSLPLAEFGLSEPFGCSPFELEIHNSSTGNPDEFFWDLGNGQTSEDLHPPPQLYTADSIPVNYTIILEAENQCGIDTHAREITVYPPNVSAFIEMPEQDACAPHYLRPISFSTPGASLNWEIILDGSIVAGSNERFPEFYLEQAGDYTVVLSASNCGSDKDTTYFSLLEAPDLDFKFRSEVCRGDSVQFTNRSVNGTAPLWSFGDGSQSNVYSPVHIFDSAGLFAISLQMEHPLTGCPAELSREIAVLGKPDSDFELPVTSGCPPLEIAFQNFSSGDTPLNYSWNFGDGSSGSAAFEPIHTYQNPGEYTISLIAFDDHFCFSDTVKKSVVVHPKPLSAFTFEDRTYCHLNDSLELFDLSEDAISYEWQIDSENYPIPNPVIHLSDPTTIEVSLTVWNIYHCADESSAEIEVLPSPEARFETEVNEGCPELEVAFFNTSENATNFNWDFGQGQSTANVSPTFVFDSSGIFLVTLTANSDNGCPSTTFEEQIHVFPQPRADFDFQLEEECVLPARINFVNHSSPGIDYHWEFGDGNTSDLDHPAHMYSDTGWYTITLDATNHHGCTAYKEKVIDIGTLPEIDIEFQDKLCAGEYLQIDNLTNYARAFYWEIGDIGSSTSTEPMFRMEIAGTYDVLLIAEYNDNCRDSLLREEAVRVHEQPIADFDYLANEDPNRIGDVEFINYSENADSYLWDFGDGNTSMAENPVYEFDDNRPLWVDLWTYNQNNGEHLCVDSIRKSVEPEWIATFFAPNSMAPEYGPGDVKYFKPVGKGIAEYEISIYSPWGEQVWFSTRLEDGSPLEFWDGTHKGEIVPQGAYVWVARITFLNGLRKVERGTVTVLR